MPKFVERITAQTFASAASTAIDVFVSGDSNARIAVDAGGKLTWGSGSGAGDVTLYRSAANALKTDDTFEGAAGLITLTTSGAPTDTLADGALAVDTTNTSLYFRADSTWNDRNLPSTTSADGGNASDSGHYLISADGGANGASL